MSTLYRPGDLIANRYQVYSMKQGGMGLIYVCYDHEEHEVVALKTFQDKFLASVGARQRFVREAALWIQLPWHPNVVFAHRIEEVGGKPYVVIDYIVGPEGFEGSSLREWITSPYLTVGKCLDFALQICMGMSYVVSKMPNFVHRDLKPENILISSDEAAKVTDFGLARVGLLEVVDGQNRSKESDDEASDMFLTGRDSVLGTPPYISPEVWTGGAHVADIRSDIYAFGCILYEMLTRKSVFPAKSVREYITYHTSVQPVSPREFNQGIPDGLEEITIKCLQKNPSERYASYNDLIPVLADLYEKNVGSPNAAFEAWQAVRGAVEVPRQYVAERYTTQANSLHVVGKYEEAIGLLNKAIELNPRNAMAWSNLANTLNAVGQHEDAIVCCDKALAITPSLVNGWVNKGVSYMSLFRYRDALECFDQACGLGSSSNLEKVWFNHGSALFALHRIEEALASLDKALAINPKYLKALAQKAGGLAALERREEALDCVNKALELDPLFSTAWFYKINFLKQMGRQEEYTECKRNFARVAEEVFLAETDVDVLYRVATSLMTMDPGLAHKGLDRVLELRPGHANALLHKAVILRQLGQLPKSLECYDRLVQLDPNHDTGWVNRGNILSDMKRLPEAIDSYTRALQINPDNDLAWQNLGNKYSDLGQPQKAVECYRRSVELNPTGRVVAWRALGTELAYLGQYEEALACLDKALAIDKTNANTWVKKSWIHLDLLNQPEAALESCNRAIAIDPDHVGAWVNRSHALMRLGQLEQALDSCEHVLAIDRRVVNGWLNKGAILLNLERFAEAVQCCDQALAIDPQVPGAWCNKGIALDALGQAENAIACWKQSVTLAPNFLSGWLNLANALFDNHPVDESIAAYQRVIQLDPTNGAAYFNIGALYYNDGNRREALSYLDKAAQLGIQRGAQLAQRIRQELGL